jgi:type I site-specific restriction-modification system R (restriction) subunit
MAPPFAESVVEQAALAWLESAGWPIKNSTEIAPGEPAAERGDYGQPVLSQRLRDALARLNPALPAEALEDAFRKLTRPSCCSSKASETYLRKIRPRTTCLYSAASMLPRNASAICQSRAS